MNGIDKHSGEECKGLSGKKWIILGMILFLASATIGCGMFPLAQYPPAKQPLYDEPAKRLDI
jgi:hypothetical protein